MRVILVAEREELGVHVRRNFHPHGTELIQYGNPIKAMDNIDEIDPDVVLFSAVDFPRHWKTFLNFLRSSRERDRAVFVLLTGAELSYEEASKAQHLGVNGIVHEDLSDKQELGRLRELVVRYKSVEEARQDRRLVPGDSDHVGFVFSHPATLQAIVGEVEDISAAGLRFVPDAWAGEQQLETDELLDLCTLRLGSDFVAPRCRVVRADGSLSVQFEDLSDADREIINSYLADRSQRELLRRSRGEASET